MMEKDIVVCSLFNKSERSNALLMVDSLRKHVPGIPAVFLVCDADQKWLAKIRADRPDIDWVTPRDVVENRHFRKLVIKYKWLGNRASYSGALKPHLIQYLIKKSGQHVIYASATCFFYQEPTELIANIKTSKAVLVPNWFTLDPKQNFSEFTRHFLEGYYNSNLIGFSKDSEELLDWWASTCQFACEKNNRKGYYYEQAYLNFLPVIFNHVKIIQDKWLLVSSWNIKQCTRPTNNHPLSVAGQYPVKAIDLNVETVDLILSSKDGNLRNLLSELSK